MQRRWLCHGERQKRCTGRLARSRWPTGPMCPSSISQDIRHPSPLRRTEMSHRPQPLSPPADVATRAHRHDPRLTATQPHRTRATCHATSPLHSYYGAPATIPPRRVIGTRMAVDGHQNAISADQLLSNTSSLPAAPMTVARQPRHPTDGVHHRAALLSPGYYTWVLYCTFWKTASLLQLHDDVELKTPKGSTV